MTTKNYSLSALLLASCLSMGVNSYAQDDSSPSINPATYHLMQSYGLTQNEANERIELQDEIVALAEDLNSGDDANFTGLYVQHEPNFKIVLQFKSQSDKVDFKKTLDPKLRRYVQTVAVKKSRAEISGDIDALIASFSGNEIPFAGGYDLRTSKYEFIVNSNEDARALRAQIPPNLRGSVSLTVDEVPTIEAAPTGVRTGDSIIGGGTIRTTASSTGSRCTLGYSVRYTDSGTAKNGILTSAHCPNTMFYDAGGHWVTLSGPDVERRTGKYDYQIFDVTGLSTNYRIMYRDLNGIPEFPSSGTFDLKRITSFMGQYRGQIVCKNGAVTGITCGEITNGNYVYNGSAGWIEVSKTRQADISAGGDSGGPWFYYPGSSREITGLGVHTAGAGTGSTSRAVYMPIDYINDHNSTVSTIKK